MASVVAEIVMAHRHSQQNRKLLELPCDPFEVTYPEGVPVASGDASRKRENGEVIRRRIRLRLAFALCTIDFAAKKVAAASPPVPKICNMMSLTMSILPKLKA
jgi:hypothetical protein